MERLKIGPEMGLYGFETISSSVNAAAPSNIAFSPSFAAITFGFSLENVNFSTISSKIL